MNLCRSGSEERIVRGEASEPDRDRHEAIEGRRRQPSVDFAEQAFVIGDEEMSDCEIDRSSVLEAGDMLDVYSAADLLAAIRQAMSRPGGLTIDLGGSARVHTAALQLIVAAGRACAEIGRDFSLRGVAPEFIELLRLTGLDRMLGSMVVDTPEAGQ